MSDLTLTFYRTVEGVDDVEFEADCCYGPGDPGSSSFCSIENAYPASGPDFDVMAIFKVLSGGKRVPADIKLTEKEEESLCEAAGEMFRDSHEDECDRDDDDDNGGDDDDE